MFCVVAVCTFERDNLANESALSVSKVMVVTDYQCGSKFQSLVILLVLQKRPSSDPGHRNAMTMLKQHMETEALWTVGQAIILGRW